MTHRPASLTAALIAGACLIAPRAEAQVVDAVLVENGFSDPLYVTSPPNEDRLYVVEQSTARIKIYDPALDLTLPAPFLDINPIASGGGEEGLLGLAFHPDYEDNGYFFVYYTNTNGNTRVARYTRLNPDQADPGSALVFLTQGQPFPNHNGGCLQFGPDGYLYIALGDGGSANDPQCNAQNPGTLLGKMLRVDVNSLDTTGAYTVPPTNPFVGDGLHLPEIYIDGVRNPWRFSFDRETGDMYIGDVGQDAREELDWIPFGTGGQNLGWRVFEGNLCNGLGACPAATTVGCMAGETFYDFPVYTYNHVGLFGGPCSVTGGYVYRGCAMPALNGSYFFADYCTAQVFTFDLVGGVATNVTERTADLDPPGALAIGTITSFGQDRQGELYIVDQAGGEIFKIVPEGGGGAACDSLIGETAVMSVADGGTHNMFLDAGAGNAGQLYLLVGSASGTVPGIPVGAFTVPLNFDPYLNATAAKPNKSPLDDSFGVLDANGKGLADFTLAPATVNPALAGTVLNHAFVVISPFGQVTFVSNAVDLTLAP